MKKILLFLCTFLAAALQAQTFTHTTGGPIPDTNTEVCFPISVTGLPGAINSTFGLTHACVNITHTYDGDLKIRLKSPDGTVILLANNNGGSGNDFNNTCFNMAATTDIGAGAPPYTGTYLPFASLNLLNNGQDPNGTWEVCVLDEVPADAGTLLSWSITFGPNPPADPIITGPCGVSNGAGCFCPDGSTDCDLLPDMTASAQIIQNQHTETPGLITLSNATPNIGWGPMEIHGSNSCWCDTVAVPCSTTICPDGSFPKQKLTQTIYHKNGSTITSTDILTNGLMSYHPSHGHVHVDNWAEFTLRKATSNPDATTWPIVAAGSKVSFCLINLGDCTSNYGYCRDGNYGPVMTMGDIPNSPFGHISGCGTDQGIYVGNLDIYSEGLPGMSIDLTGVCNGDYYIVSITDPDNNFLETDETNNWAATPITLTQQIAGPTASFTYTATGPSVQFNNPPTITNTYNWYFGDGGTSNVQNPSHVYMANGVYNVTLVVSSDCGSDTTTQIITVSGVGVEESSASSMGLTLFPNPVAGVTTLSFFLAAAGPVDIEVCDMTGSVVHQLKESNVAAGYHESQLDLTGLNLANGIYFVRVAGSQGSAAVRLTIIR
jgi:subtilisin-like proprotein convertase family protein